MDVCVYLCVYVTYSEGRIIWMGGWWAVFETAKFVFSCSLYEEREGFPGHGDAVLCYAMPREEHVC